MTVAVSGGDSRDAAVAPEGEAEKGVGGWIRKQFEKFDTIHVTLLGIALYVMVYFSYSTFYDRFAVSPTEVGLTYVEILTRSAPPLLVLLGFIWLIYAIGRFLLRRDLAARARYPLITLVVAILTVLIAGPVRAYRLADLVERGNQVRSQRLFGEIPDVRADYVTVIADTGADSTPAEVSTNATEPELPRLRPDPATGLQPDLELNFETDVAARSGSTLKVTERRTLLYLGQANGVAVLYDPLQRQTIRMPTGGMTIIVE